MSTEYRYCRERMTQLIDFVSKRRKWIGLGLIALAAVAIAGVRIHTTQQEIVPEYVFSYAENQREDYPTTLAARRFAELVEERTEGRIRIIVYAEGELGNEMDVIRQLQFGGIDFARVSLSPLAESIPELNVLQMPYLYNDSKHMWKVLDGEIGDAFLHRVQGKELIGLSWYDAGARNFYNSLKPITSPEDMEGMRIRVQESDVMVDMVEALGATAYPISYEEVYSSLEQGLCDGAENNWPSYEAMHHCEVAKYYTVDEHTRVPEMQICSKHTWEQLSVKDRKIILDCAAESALYQRQLWTEREAQSRRVAVQNGVEEVVLTVEQKEEFRERMSDVYEKYCSDYMDVITKILEKGNQ